MIKKSLGQNFFVNENLGRGIIEYIEKESPDVIVEIGPGHGFFTKKLYALGKPLILIEKDNLLADSLRQEYPNAEIINKDFLEWDMDEIKKYKDLKATFFGSLPYNVSKPIIHMIISSGYFNNSSYFIVQKEVAQKYTAKAPDNNILSLKTQLYADSKKLFDIGPKSFFPSPKVDSSYIKFTPNNISVPIKKELMVSFIEKCFRSPRKTLRNNLKTNKASLEVENILNKRPSQLSLEEYIFLFTNLQS